MFEVFLIEPATLNKWRQKKWIRIFLLAEML